ncbi:DUF1465 family protein [Bartonella sp. TP]|uniref:DUF1465 family protein n=1 Tax=Bartonella sp. TP TaxID=3057550 RepID=UPI0025B21B28|nr:DUF1465 family protein [Bartonella sp. TP]MDN5248715.1 DUF1465 family protein [Alphaproteobacteria bacterium]WJW79622.1 DUF1465 family protein [Bartonella sp. TP]
MQKKRQKFITANNMLILMENQAYAAVFAKTYARGMQLIECTAAYIDGPGKSLLRELDEEQLALYTREAGAISTRLMQIASWLLLFRAWLEKDMSLQRIKDEKTKICLQTPSERYKHGRWDELPEIFRLLVLDSLRLETRLRNLDSLVSKALDGIIDNDNFVRQQQKKLYAAFNANLI